MQSQEVDGLQEFGVDVQLVYIPLICCAISNFCVLNVIIFGIVVCRHMRNCMDATSLSLEDILISAWEILLDFALNASF